MFSLYHVFKREVKRKSSFFGTQHNYLFTLLFFILILDSDRVRRIKASCPLCNGPPETGHHLCLLFPLHANGLVASFHLGAFVFVIPQHAAAISVHKSQRRKFNGMAIYIMWNLWKERNRRVFLFSQTNPRVFENKHCTVTQVVELFLVFWSRPPWREICLLG